MLCGGQEQESEEGGVEFPAVFAWCAGVEGQSGVGVCGHRAALGCPVEEWGAALGCWWVLGGLSVLVSCLVFVLCETAAWE